MLYQPRSPREQMDDAIDAGIDYWRGWFNQPGEFNEETCLNRPRSIILGQIDDPIGSPEVAQIIVEGTREIAFDIDYGDITVVRAFNLALQRFVFEPRECQSQSPRNVEGLSEPVLHLAQLVANFYMP